MLLWKLLWTFLWKVWIMLRNPLLWVWMLWSWMRMLWVRVLSVFWEDNVCDGLGNIYLPILLLVVFNCSVNAGNRRNFLRPLCRSLSDMWWRWRVRFRVLADRIGNNFAPHNNYILDGIRSEDAALRVQWGFLWNGLCALLDIVKLYEWLILIYHLFFQFFNLLRITYKRYCL